MNAAMIRTMYEYHRALNRQVWDQGIMSLSDEQYTQGIPYSIGSVRNHVVHLVSVDERWFARLRLVDLPPRLDPDAYPDRASIRSRWDEVEATMQDYLDALTDEQTAATRMYMTGRRGEVTSVAWRILLHVVNHGTDHRAQLLRILYEFGAPTLEQDMMIYWWSQEDVAR